ncbi:helix-turn-helix domain-containing protein [Bacteroides xylanisolvens]|uniref:helix-turn-helix domain-containing protein n=1 Tax=Bacteroides xylanisolvens TaxID=371601 RepID=UPI00356556F7
MNSNTVTPVVLVPQSVLDELIQEVKAVKEICMNRFQENKTGEEWLSSEEVKSILGVSAKTWQKYRNEKRIPFSQFGRKIYVKKADLDAFMEKHKIKGRND